jgi:hypothetical protein
MLLFLDLFRSKIKRKEKDRKVEVKEKEVKRRAR